jgi:Flp pilus assembly protein TadD
MKCARYLAALVLLTACSNHAEPQLSNGVPSLRTARIALQSGAPNVALGICSRAVESDYQDAAALACEGDALTMLGRPADADTAYTKALTLSPGSVPVLLGLGRLRLATDPKRAELLFLMVLAQNPRNAVALNDLGIARDLQGHHAEAQQSYAAASAADPDMRAAQVNLALSMALQGRPADAARLLGPIASSPDATTRERHDMAVALAMSGNTDAAKQLLRHELQGADLDAAIAGYRALMPDGAAPP